MAEIAKLTAVALLILLAAACQEAPSPTAERSPAETPTEAVMPTSSSLPSAGATTPTPAPKCLTEDLEARFVGAQRAGTTTFLTFRLSNVSGAACRLQGFVDLQMLDATGSPLPTRVVRSGHLLARQPPAPAFVLPPAAAATFLVAYSNSPGQRESGCPQAYQLLLTPPDQDRHLSLAVAGWSLAPCDGGELDVAPLWPAAMTTR